ncbi:3-oxoadipate enol-lactonase [Kitasatospora sp. GAS204A]|nr:3-oxoadipate enol-lactonase [Kitasatospora sp. GAS204B]
MSHRLAYRVVVPTVQVGELDVYYEVHGSGPPLLLIGGLGADLTLFAPLTERLVQRYQVIVFDNRGAGRSGKPDQPYSIPLMADDAIGLLDALGIARAHLLGVSMGGRIALEIAIGRPERVDRLVLVASSAAGRGRLTVSWPMRLLGMAKRLGLVRREHAQPDYAFRRQLAASVGYSALDRLGGVRAPTLILHGRQDRSMPLDAARATGAGIAGARLELFDGGHLFFLLAQRAAVLDRVERFLSEAR